MTTVSMRVDAGPEDVFAVLSDPPSYGGWVVGSKHIRDFDRQWPTPGTALHHTLGVGPVTIRDDSRVLEVELDRRLVLEVHTGPLGDAEVTFELEPAGSGTTVRMTEVPVAGLLRRLPRRVVDPVLRLRNAETLRRLKREAERRRSRA